MRNLGLKPRSAKQPRLTKDAAEALAVEALGYLASDPARLHRFFSLSGLTLESLRAAAQEPQFLAAVLDYFASDETLLLAFAASAGHDPAALAMASSLLSSTGGCDL